jgi:TRAP-type mannitol/chloroaromatic compound transport system permease small subunit
MIGEHSSNSPTGPPLYPFKTLSPIVGVLMLVQGIAEVIRCVLCLRSGDWPQRLHDVEELEKIILQQAKEKLETAS